MAEVVMFLIAVVIFVCAYSFVSTFVIPILALYILLGGWEKTGTPLKVIAIGMSLFSIAIFLIGSALDGDLLSNIDITTVIPFLSISLVAIAYFRKK